MKKIEKILLLSLFSFILFINGCSSTKDIISISETHLYNDEYGLNTNLEIDTINENELVTINSPIEMDTPKDLNPEWTTELEIEDGAFLAEDYVQKEPVITYKYKFDSKFYTKAEWRTIE